MADFVEGTELRFRFDTEYEHFVQALQTETRYVISHLEFNTWSRNPSCNSIISRHPLFSKHLFNVWCHNEIMIVGSCGQKNPNRGAIRALSSWAAHGILSSTGEANFLHLHRSCIIPPRPVVKFDDLGSQPGSPSHETSKNRSVDQSISGLDSTQTGPVVAPKDILSFGLMTLTTSQAHAHEEQDIPDHQDPQLLDNHINESNKAKMFPSKATTHPSLPEKLDSTYKSANSDLSEHFFPTENSQSLEFFGPEKGYTVAHGPWIWRILCKDSKHSNQIP